MVESSRSLVYDYDRAWIPYDDTNTDTYEKLKVKY